MQVIVQRYEEYYTALLVYDFRRIALHFEMRKRGRL